MSGSKSKGTSKNQNTNRMGRKANDRVMVLRYVTTERGTQAARLTLEKVA